MDNCNQCEALHIWGVYCHEAGCINSGKKKDSITGEWFKHVECQWCGCEVKEGDNCCTE